MDCFSRLYLLSDNFLWCISTGLNDLKKKTQKEGSHLPIPASRPLFLCMMASCHKKVTDPTRMLSVRPVLYLPWQINSMLLIQPEITAMFCVSGLYNLQGEWHRQSLDPRFEWGKASHNEKKKNTYQVKKDGRRATEEGSVSQDGQTCNKRELYRTEQHHTVYKFNWQNIWYK